MFAPPPKTIKVSISTDQFNKMISFYFSLGMLFHEEKTDNGRLKGTYQYGDMKFEIREVESSGITKNLRLQFMIDEIDGYLDEIENLGGQIIKAPWIMDKYKHVEFIDPFGNYVELITLNLRENKN